MKMGFGKRKWDWGGVCDGICATLFVQFVQNDKPLQNGLTFVMVCGMNYVSRETFNQQ